MSPRLGFSRTPGRCGGRAWWRAPWAEGWERVPHDAARRFLRVAVQVALSADPRQCGQSPRGVRGRDWWRAALAKHLARGGPVHVTQAEADQIVALADAGWES